MVSYCLEKERYIESDSKHCSIVFLKNKIFSISINSGYHAEINSLRKYFNVKNTKSKRKYFNILVIRVKENKLQNSKPCLHCINNIKQYDFCKYIFYSTGNGNEIKKEKNGVITNNHISRGNKKLLIVA